MRVNPINMRLYRRFDADLIALHESGIPVNVLAEVLLELYANGKYVTIIPEGCQPFDVGKRKNIHLTVNVKPGAASKLVSQIRYGFRNQFCKSLIRDALRTDPLWVYFSNDEYTETENQRIKDFARQGNVIVLPAGLRRKDYRALLTGEEVTKRRKKKTEQPKTQQPETQHLKEEEKPKIEEKSKIRLQKQDITNRPNLDDIEGWGKKAKMRKKEKKNQHI